MLGAWEDEEVGGADDDEGADETDEALMPWMVLCQVKMAQGKIRSQEFKRRRTRESKFQGPLEKKSLLGKLERTTEDG